MAACNYDAAAEQDNGSCTYAAEGFDCDGNCLEGTFTSINVQEVYPDYGWTYSLVSYGGYWDLVDLSTGSSMVAAISDDESLCLPDGCYEISGMSGSFGYAFGYSIDGGEIVTAGEADAVGSDIINMGDGCVTGCTDEAAENYDAAAHISDNSLCEYALVPGCTDMAACNYDAVAEQDNGSCTYAAEGFDCDGNCLEGTFTSINVQEVYPDYGWTYSLVSYGGYWDLVDLSTGSSMVAATSDDESLCLPDGCYEISGMSGSFGYAFGYSIDGGEIMTAGEADAVGSDIINMGDGCVTGCTDEAAENYDATAHISDNSLCEYAFVLGCTDVTACNYDPTAEQDNGSCESAPEGFDCDGNCLSGSLLTITLSDSYGDGWNGNSLTVDGVDYTQVES